MPLASCFRALCLPSGMTHSEKRRALSQSAVPFKAQSWPRQGCLVQRRRYSPWYGYPLWCDQRLGGASNGYCEGGNTIQRGFERSSSVDQASSGGYHLILDESMRNHRACGVHLTCSVSLVSSLSFLSFKQNVHPFSDACQAKMQAQAWPLAE